MKEKMEFVTSELWILAWGASVQRANLYGEKNDSDSLSNKTRTMFQEDVIKFITEIILPQYVEGCTEEQHYANIETLITHANKVSRGQRRRTTIIKGKIPYAHSVI